jgi:hypothetical protein
MRGLGVEDPAVQWDQERILWLVPLDWMYHHSPLKLNKS